MSLFALMVGVMRKLLYEYQSFGVTEKSLQKEDWRMMSWYVTDLNKI